MSEDIKPQTNLDLSETEEWYRDYYNKKGHDRNDLLKNNGVLFQHLANEAAVLNVLANNVNLDKGLSKILDVGCGDGGSLVKFAFLGFSPNNIYGIDIIKTRIDMAKQKYTNFNFISGDASCMPYETDTFDLVMESTMFVQLTNHTDSLKIAKQMIRVTKPNGYIMLIDWRYSKPGSSYLGLSCKRIRKLFSVGDLTEIVCRKNAALIPPVGRALSKYFPAVYFITGAIFPFLAGMKVTLLKKL